MRKNVKNLLRILLLFPLVLVFGMGLYLKLTPIILKTILALRIESIPSVSGLDIRTEGVWFDSCEFTVLIKYRNGGMLKLYNVNGWGRGEIDIFRVDDYVVYIVDEQGYNGIKPEKKLSCWSLITGLKLETVIDVARNHETIADYVGKWPDISEYQEDELAYKVLKRVMRDNLFVGNDIMFEERKYFLLKMAY